MIPNMFKIAGELTPGGDPRRGPHRRHPRPVDLRRPQRRDARAHDRLGDARRWLGPGGARLRAGRPRGHAPRPGSRSSISSTASARRTRSTRSSLLDDDDMRALVREEDVLAFRGRGMTPDAPGRARHGPEPRRLLPGARGGQPVPPGRARDRPGRDGRAGRPDRPAVRAGRLPRRRRRRTRDRGDGLGDRRDRGDRRHPGGRRRDASACCASGCSSRSRPSRSSPPCRRRSAAIAVLDRTKEPGAVGEPLYLEVVAGLAEAMDQRRPAVRGAAPG